MGTSRVDMKLFSSEIGRFFKTTLLPSTAIDHHRKKQGTYVRYRFFQETPANTALASTMQHQSPKMRLRASTRLFTYPFARCDPMAQSPKAMYGKGSG